MLHGRSQFVTDRVGPAS